MSSSQYYNNQYSNSSPGGNQYYPSQHQTNPTGYGGSQAGSYAASPQSVYRAPQEDEYRRASVQRNMQVGPYQDDYDYDDRPHHHHHHHHGSNAGYSDRSRSHERSRGGSFDEARRDSGTPPIQKSHHATQKKLGATVLGGAVGAFAVHELGHGHHDIATAVGGLAGAWAGNKLEKKHEVKKQKEQLRKASEEGVGVGGGYLVRNDERRSSRDMRRYDDDGSSDSDSSGGSRRRRHHHP